MMDHIDIHTLESLRRAKTDFHNKLCRGSSDSDPLLLQKLRSENVFVLSEFFFLLSAFDLIASPAKLEAYILSHNEQLTTLIQNEEQRKLMGLEVPRLKRGVFSMIQVHKAKANLLSATPGLDQADIQRLTIMLFSPETGRRVIESMETAGFLTRVATPYYSKIVQSHGAVEKYFAEYLAQVRADVPHNTTPQPEVQT
ncbi:hypothetical protein G5B38_08970 [Pseudohalocynthiibacter aestuariivivens]|uniref:Uncharacterized protein n=1 Tax=Roseovarius pelagicus TaxID=2980108 RepID=A0ABY6D8L3_9RHOB|nr:MULTISPECIES: hypothetical protein [Rhodobacterales]QIE45647.1 hypothetical protein G5B38_08970 [Pseudohalocynthiibacter aestuariivivens]UXX82435.1 hypothetical protein N7U68_15220 [Roseovarius pelagicus]